MTLPAVAASGASYEREAIVQWLKKHKRDPLTGQDIRSEQLSPNLNLYNALESWLVATALPQVHAAAAAGAKVAAESASQQDTSA